MSLFLLEAIFPQSSALMRAGSRLRASHGVNGVDIVSLHKVLGERKLVIVTKGNEDAVERVVYILEEGAELGTPAVTCIPVRAYEKFARKALGVEEAEDAAVPSMPSVCWMQFDIDFTGSTEDAMAVWAKEARLALSVRKSGRQVYLFKAIGQRRVDVFLGMNDHDDIDDLVWSLPLVQELGASVRISTRKLHSTF